MAATLTLSRTGGLERQARLWAGKVWLLPKVSTFLLLLVVVSAVFAGAIAPRDPLRTDIVNIFAPPVWQAGGSAAHILGTDELGRDVLSRIIYGARVSLVVGLGAVAAATAVGTALGLLSGYFGRRVDMPISAAVDVWLSIPPILFLLLLALVMGRSTEGVIIGLAVLGWPKYTRIVRGQSLTIKERGFVSLARVAGCSSWRIMAVHIFPNVVNSVVVLATLDVGRFIVLESSLSFLGLGVRPPTPAWGVMIADSRNQLALAWWTAIMPGIALAVTVLAANSFGDWLRDKLDPMQRNL